ncbi:hypothetical protein FHL15_001137 [Xylaria flabelliformis]|uniref:Uncharacterized protein n=1 Tax=Xylaria flabelliformis TaxID=2512241 RepID=A0A553ICJ7_9PEZI|nr:hypothetical protein FHL15_001137 [Xylaria flabelliformis]
MPAPLPPPQPTFWSIPQYDAVPFLPGRNFQQSISCKTTYPSCPAQSPAFLPGVPDLIQNLELRLGAMESNSIARLINTGVIDRDALLTPLHKITTNTTIVGFPRTKAALNELDEVEVTLDIILEEIGHLVKGDVRAKKDRLAVLTGATNIRELASK